MVWIVSVCVCVWDDKSERVVIVVLVVVAADDDGAVVVVVVVVRHDGIVFGTVSQ